MGLYNFDKFNKNHIGEHYVFVWDDGKEKSESCEAYFMKWNGFKHEIYLEAYGQDEVEALSYLLEKLDKQLVEHLSLYQTGKKYIDKLFSNYIEIQ